MLTIMRWTGREARLLREAGLRMSIRDFAAHTNLSTYAIRDFETKGEQANLRISTQKILDEVLAGAPDDARQRFAAALDPAARHHSDYDEADSQSKATLVPRPRAVDESPWQEVDETKRRDALATLLAIAAGTSLPSRDRRTTEGIGLDQRTLAGYVEVADTLASMYRSVDPRVVLSMAAAYADELLAAYERLHLGGMANALAPIVVGVHCQVGLWACHAHRPTQARRYLATACEVATDLDDGAWHARALGALAYLHSSAPRGGAGGRPRRALELLGQALALASRADRFTRGWLATWRADQHAALGNLAAARADLDLADALLDGGDGPDTGFFARGHYGYGMRGHLDSVRGLVHALAGEVDESEQIFEGVQAGAANGRRRIASLGHQAMAYARAAEPEAACEALDRSLSMMEAEPYAMGLQRAIGVRAGFDASWAEQPCVRDLDQRLASLASAGAGTG